MAAMGLAVALWKGAREHGTLHKDCPGKAHPHFGVIRRIEEHGVTKETHRNQLGSRPPAFRLANPRSALTRRTAEQAVSMFLEGAATGKSKRAGPGSIVPA